MNLSGPALLQQRKAPKNPCLSAAFVIRERFGSNWTNNKKYKGE